jgi:hypothetical protein
VGAIFFEMDCGKSSNHVRDPGNDKPRHLEDNMQGGIGRLPDAKLRRRMAELVSSL